MLANTPSLHSLHTPALALILLLSTLPAPAEARSLLEGLARRTAETAIQGATRKAQQAPARAPVQQPEAGAEAPAPDAGPTMIVKNDMSVLSSDGVRVAEINHVPNGARAYGPDEMFFTADRYYNLRRIYGREASVSGNTVYLKMTAAAFRARKQNPE